MKLHPRLQTGTFLVRLNRFAAQVQIGPSLEVVHVANSGRMAELLQRGNPVLLTPTENPHRKTRFDLTLVDLGHTLVSADARLPPALVAEQVAQGRLAPFCGLTQVLREVGFEESRLDLELRGPGGRCLVEAKSVTLVRAGVGLFPDAPTERGRRHLEDLRQAVEQGLRAAVVFVIQRPDAWAMAPNDQADPAFGEALRQAARVGVEAYAYTCIVSRREVRLHQSVPVLLERTLPTAAGTSDGQ